MGVNLLFSVDGGRSITANRGITSRALSLSLSIFAQPASPMVLMVVQVAISGWLRFSTILMMNLVASGTSLDATIKRGSPQELIRVFMIKIIYRRPAIIMAIVIHIANHGGDPPTASDFTYRNFSVGSISESLASIRIDPHPQL